jgi:hypothetical protein
MARVMTKTMKQASLNLKDMVDKKPLSLEIEDFLSDVKINTTGTLQVAGNRVWSKDDAKPEIIENAIDQAKALFNVGKEISGWSATYYPAADAVKGSELSIPPGEKGLGCRFIIVVGTREVANLCLSVGSTNAENSLLMLSGDCINLKITVCPVLTTTFKNINAEKMSMRAGFRETVIRKTYNTRHVLVLDGHVEMGSVVSHVTKQIMGKEKKEISSSDVDEVAKSASSE